MAISLASIARTTRNSLPPRIVLHGPQKVGKTTFGANAFNPIFIAVEDGLSGIATNAVNGGNRVESFADVLAWLALLATEANEFGTVVIDSLDWLEPLVWEHTCKRMNWADIEAPGYGKGYIEANADWRRFFDACDRARLAGKAIVCIAHSVVKSFAPPDGEAYDRYELKLQKGALGLAVEWADIIGFAQEEVAIKKEKDGFDKVRSRGISTGRRVLRLSPKPSYIAGNRYDLPDTLPLDWNALVAAMQPQEPAANEPAADASAAA
jgi:hypothetical protein